MKRQILISSLILLFIASFATAATLTVPVPYSTIQAAINAAADGDVVLVDPGAYYETIDFSGAAACTVTSTDSLDPDIVANTIIDGTGIGGSVVTFGPVDDPNFFVPRDDPNFKEFVLAGFTITGGVSGYGGGIFCDADSVPTIKNCHIVGNSAVDMGMYEGDGGGVYLTSSSARFIGCLIMNNSAEWYGGGIYCEGQAELSEDLPEFFNCLIANNQSLDYGGAMYCFDSSPVITLSTIANNSGYYDPDIHGTVGSDINGYGGIYCVENSSPTITNCIVWGNGDDLYECEATYSCIEDGDEGEGNIDDDPLFVRGPFGVTISGGFGDYYLSQLAGRQLVDSPCVNAGTGSIRDYLVDYIVLYGLGLMTTCTDNTPDASLVDMGYHYNYYYGPPIMYELKIFVVGNGTTNPTPDPFSHFYPMYTQVLITAIPDPNHRVKQWIGTDNDLSFASFNTVIMDSDKNVSVEFELSYPSNLHVGAGYEYIVIQDAINDARDGDIVMIHSGTYPSQAGFTVIGKDITITGTNPSDPNIVASTIIDCAGESSGGFYIFGSGIGSCVLKGITIMNSHSVVLTPWHGTDRPPGSRGYDGGSHMGGGALSLYGNHTVVNCVIRDCSVEGADADYGWDGDDDVPGGDGGDGGDAAGAGIYIGWGNPLIKNCTVDNCIATGGDGGAGANGGNLTSGGDGGVTGRAMGGGVYYAAGTWPTFINCTITNCQAIGGLGGDGGDATGIAGAGGYGGLTYYDPGQGNPVYYSSYGGGVYCALSTNATFTGCTFSNNVSDGSVSGQGGLSAAGVQNQPHQNFNIPSYGAGAYYDIGSFTTLANCTFQGNLASYYADQYTGYGGGVCFESASYAELNNCHIIDNNAPVGGGVYGSAVADFHVLDCNFVDNSAYVGGGLLSIENMGNISGCTIIGNSADDPSESIFGSGGGIFSFSSDILISDCNISGNSTSGSGGGVYFGGDPETITPFYGAPTLKNCLVLNNTAGRDGGGVSCDWYSEPTIINCTIADNMVTGGGFDTTYGGGLYVSYESDVNVIDSIIWSNFAIKGPQVAVGTGFEYDPAPSKVTVSYCDIGPLAGLVDFETGEPFWADWDQNDGATLIDAQTIYDQFGVDGWAEVIVSLFEPVEMREATDWDSPESVAALRAEIASRQSAVLSTLTPAEFTLRYRYDNQAGFSGEVTIEGLNKLLSNPLVAYIEPVRYVQPALAQAISLANGLETRQVYDGTGIAVAIVDSGVDYTHPRLGGSGFPNAKVIGGYDTGNNDNDPMPFDEAHGTCCAGIAAGDLGTVGDYIGGVAPNAKIYALKLTTDAGLWPTDSAVASWDWCVTHRNDDPDNPILVMSNSWYMPLVPFNDPAIADAVSPALTVAADSAVAVGITILACSGNDGFAGQGISWPSAMSNVISVGAVDDVADTVMDYSNTADNLDILAPADPIYTTDIVGPGGYDPGDYYPYFNGTSAACPFAAGAVASRQSAAMAEWGHYLNPEQVRTVLVVSGVPVTDTKVNITKPRVNLAAAISYLIAPPIYVEEGCTFIGWDPNAVNVGDWDPNFSEYANISESPLFVDGYLLSQTEAGQEEDSPCVDAGSDLAINLGLNIYTTRTDWIFDKGIVDMGYHYPLPEMAQPCRLCDLLYDGIIDFYDLAILVSHWLDSCDPGNNWCDGADIDSDTTVNLLDYALLAACWQVEDTSPPIPNPSEWEIEPHSTSTTSIGMTAKTAVDAWWGSDVEYYFQRTDANGSPDGSFRDWDPNSAYIDDGNGLGLDPDPNTEYGYRVRARDASSRIPDDGTGEPGNKTGWSLIRYAAVGEEEDHNPPTPNPMTWEVLSYTATQDSITLFATTAIDDTAGVEYYFENFDFPGVNSGWIGEPTWTDVGLMPNTTYTYRVRARDTSPWQNETAWSVLLDATTLEEGAVPDTTPPTPDPMVFDPVVIGPYDGFPREVPGGGGPADHSATMRAIDADDPSGVEYFFECIELPGIWPDGLSSGWRTIQDYPDELERRTWNVPVGFSGHYYQFRVRARDAASPPNYTDWSPPDPAEPTG